MKRLIATLLLFAPIALAEDAARNPFPDDYTPTTCPQVSCQSYEESQFPGAAADFLGFRLDPQWLHANLPKIQAAMEKSCAKLTTCFATAPNTKLFCLDATTPEFRDTCGRLYPKETMPGDNEQCLQVVETYVLGLDQRMQPRYNATRECAMQHPDTRTNKTLDVWMVPANISPAKPVTEITVYAIDHDTHIPILGSIKIENQILYAPSNPVGNLATGYPFKWPLKYVRIKNAEGRTQSVGPMLTLTTEGYPDVSFRIPVDVPAVTVSTNPDLSHLRAGKKATVTVSVADARTGQPVEGHVMLGSTQVGTANTPFTFVPKKGAGLWLADLSNGASDVDLK